MRWAARLGAAVICIAGVGQASDWVTATGEGIAAARFEVPDDVYPHRIMGSLPEMRVLAVRDGMGREMWVDLRNRPPGTHVFEDIAPRVVDADGDGLNDVVVVEADPEHGAQLAIYGLRRGTLTKTAATPHIGTPFRWLAPVAVADLDGNGIIDLAYVETPHLGKRLRVWSWAPGGLTEIAALDGLTNHRIGEEFISGGLRDCGAGPEMLLADAAWREVTAVRLAQGRLTARGLGLTPDAAGFASAAACEE